MIGTPGRRSGAIRRARRGGFGIARRLDSSAIVRTSILAECSAAARINLVTSGRAGGVLLIGSRPFPATDRGRVLRPSYSANSAGRFGRRTSGRPGGVLVLGRR